MSTKITRDAKNKMARYFEPRVQRYGHSYVSVGWASAESQRQRFRVMSEIAELDECRILDAGCGVGQFYGFLQEAGFEVNYTGVDLYPSMIACARRHYPDATFIKTDILSYKPETVFDYAFAVGIYNVETGDNEEVMKAIIENLYATVCKGVGVSLTYGSELPACIHSFDPDTMYEFGKRFAPDVHIRSDHLENDFAMYLYKEQEC